jgi:hypothetical protein
MTSTDVSAKGSDIGSSGSIDGSMRSAGVAATARGTGAGGAGGVGDVGDVGASAATVAAGAAGAVAARSTYTALNTSVVIQRFTGVLAQ